MNQDSFTNIQQLQHQLEELAQVGAWQYRTETEETICTTQVFKIHELPATLSISYQHIISLYTAQSQDVFKAAIRKTLTEGLAYDLVLFCHTAQHKKLIKVHCKGQAIYEQEKILGFVGTFQPIFKKTAQSDSNEELQMLTQELVYHNEQLNQINALLEQKQKFLDKVTELSPNGIYIFDIEKNNNTFTNKGGLDFLGYSAEEVAEMGKYFLKNILHPEDFPASLKRWEQYQNMKDGEPLEFVQRVKDKSGKWRWLHNREVIFSRDEYGKPTELLGNAQEITALKLAEFELKSQQKSLLETQKIAKIGRWEYCVTNNTITWSSETYEILGIEKLTDSAALAELYLENIPPDDRQLFLENQRRAIIFEESYEMVSLYKNAKGEYLHLFVKAHPIIENGRVVKIVGIAQDITERKQNEKRLAKLNTSKDRLLATVAHDLRNPINTIQGAVSVIRLQNPDLKEDELDFLEIIVNACKKGLGLIKELLEVASLEDENFELATQKTELNAFLEESIRPLQTQIKRKNIHFELQLIDRELFVPLNHAKFSRVIENLVSNAIKFTQEEGSIVIQTCFQEEEAVLKIKDTGIGIPASLQPIIFDKFSAARRTGLKGEKSTGLGMFIVKQIITLHRGSIRLESQENKGSTFEIRLPFSSKGHSNKDV